jgi:hypothetical protein
MTQVIAFVVDPQALASQLEAMSVRKAVEQRGLQNLR